MAVDLPAPLHKVATIRRPLKIEVALQSGKKTSVQASYGDVKLHAQLTEPEAGFHLEQMQLAAGRALPPPVPGSPLLLSLESLDLEPWQAFLNEGKGDSQGAPASLPLQSLDLDIARAAWGSHELGDLNLQLRSTEDHWQGQLAGRLAQGQFAWNGAGVGALHLDLQHLTLPKSEADRLESASANPAQFPRLSLRCQEFRWQEKSLGPLELETEPQANGMDIRKLSLGAQDRSLNLRGSWTLDAAGEQSRVVGKLHTLDLGKLLADLGYAREIRETPADLGFSLGWKGPPQAITPALLVGKVRVQLGRGALLKVDPGLGRALVVLNLQALSRLLLLDFNDLFGKGLSYNGMSGRFKLNNGQAETQGFLLDAAAAKIFLTGRIGLVTRDLDEVVTVIPHTLASLPLTGAMVGGAAVSMAIDMAKNLFGAKSIHLASTRYSLKGKWEDPQITRIAGNLPLEVLERAWTGVKDFSGFGNDGVEEEDE
jgi:uncharacterized protein YhdP